MREKLKLRKKLFLNQLKKIKLKRKKKKKIKIKMKNGFELLCYNLVM